MTDLKSLFHIAIKVSDPDQSRNFYREQLGAEVIANKSSSDPAEIDRAILELADKRVYLFDRAPYEDRGLVDELPPGFLHFGYTVDNLGQVYEEMDDAGVSFFMEPTQFSDLKIAFFTDPTGVRIELLEHL